MRVQTSCETLTQGPLTLLSPLNVGHLVKPRNQCRQTGYPPDATLHSGFTHSPQRLFSALGFCPGSHMALQHSSWMSALGSFLRLALVLGDLGRSLASWGERPPGGTTLLRSARQPRNWSRALTSATWRTPTWAWQVSPL